VRIITQSQVHSLLPMDECMSVMTDALVSLAKGGCVNPLRPMMRIPEQRGIMGLMPAYLDSPESLGVKIITVFNANHGTEYDSHQGVVLLFEAVHGSPVAMIDASAITAIRTAAVSGVATRALAREDARELCIFGSGVQAQTHLDAMLVARPIRRVRVWSRNVANARSFAEQASKAHGIPVEPFEHANEAAKDADIICTVTSSKEPVLVSSWVADGAHVNAVGSSQPSARELDSDLVARGRLFVDRRESALNEAGDFLVPRKEGRFGDEHIQAELGEILAGTASGRGSASELTIFKSLGLGVEDVAAAHRIHANAVDRGIGVEIELGGKKLH
jgi:alanine dehydrogenase